MILEYLGNAATALNVQVKIPRRRTLGVRVGGGSTPTEHLSHFTKRISLGSALKWNTSSLATNEDTMNVRKIAESIAAPPTHQINILDPSQIQMNWISSITGKARTITPNSISCRIVNAVVRRVTIILSGRLFFNTLSLSSSILVGLVGVAGVLERLPESESLPPTQRPPLGVGIPPSGVLA